MRRSFLALGLALAAGLWMPGAGAVEAVHADFSRTSTLAPGAWEGYQIYILNGVQVSVDIRASGDVDFYVLTSTLLPRYEEANASAFPAIVSVEGTRRFQYSTTTCCRIFVIDNAAKSPTGQDPDGPESYTIDVVYGTPTGSAGSAPLPEWTYWAYPAAVVVLVVGTSYWLLTPPRRGRHASAQLREFLR